MTPEVRPLRTTDGSVTLQQCATGWTYRSTHGAKTEAKTVFVDGSAIARVPAPRRVLELGFGAATNFAATLESLGRDGLHYCGVDEAFVAIASLPVPPHVGSLIAQARADGVATRGPVTLELVETRFSALALGRTFDAIYFDPFGPDQQPHSWSVEIFEVARRHAGPRARLVTYSAAGQVRRNLAAAGFHVATAPGPPGKREFTVASLDPSCLGPLKIRNAPG